MSHLHLFGFIVFLTAAAGIIPLTAKNHADPVEKYLAYALAPLFGAGAGYHLLQMLGA